MKPKHRFYIPPSNSALDAVTLEGSEAHHAIHVLRIEAGEAVEIFDGQGTLFQGEVCSVSKKSMEIEVINHTFSALRSPSIILTQSWLNHEKNHEGVIRRASELGVSEIRFVKTQHSERKPKENAKWERWAIESCKQCKRVWLPQIGIVDQDDLGNSKELHLIATQHAEPTPLSNIEFSDAPINIHVGPEGDFSRDEVKAYLNEGAIPIGFGNATYRSELAAQVAITLVQFQLGEMGPR